MKKVALVYTVATEAMSAYLLDRLHALMGENIEVASYADESILQDVLHAGKITPFATRKLLGLYLQAMQEGADGILSVCSSVGEVADAMETLNAFTESPVIRIDTHMCACAAQEQSSMAIAATFPTALESTRRKLLCAAEKQGKALFIQDILLQDGFGSKSLYERLLAAVRELTPMPSALVLCQASMALDALQLRSALQIPVYASPDYGIAQLKKALED